MAINLEQLKQVLHSMCDQMCDITEDLEYGTSCDTLGDIFPCYVTRTLKDGTHIRLECTYHE